MKNTFDINYVNRKSGIIETEKVYAGGFLYWLYNSITGKYLQEMFLRYKYFSLLYGWFNRTQLSRKRINSFVREMNVNTSENTKPLSNYKSFSDFFIREIDLKARPIVGDDRVCISPADGKILAYQRIDPKRVFLIKRASFQLESLLNDDRLTVMYSLGSMIVVRLGLADYHHFHFPDSGIPYSAQVIPGKYHASGPYSLHEIIPFYAENYRMITVFESDNFDSILMIEIGAFTVGSIRQCYQPNKVVSKEAHKGYFELGGSTIVLLFKEGAVILDDDLCENTEHELETFVRFGESIGQTVDKDRRQKLRR